MITIGHGAFVFSFSLLCNRLASYLSLSLGARSLLLALEWGLWADFPHRWISACSQLFRDKSALIASLALGRLMRGRHSYCISAVLKDEMEAGRYDGVRRGFPVFLQ